MPEFPLSRPDLKGTEAPREHRGRSGMDFEGHHHWRLVQIQYYANLQPSQIVREMDAPDRGWEADPAKGDEHAPRAARQDATADSDRQRENTNLVTVDERRYVVDPVVGDHTYTGLWTGGPIQYVVAQGRKVLRQTLTRTWCAGHGYKVAADGSYVAVWPNGSKPSDAGGVHGTGSAGKTGVGDTREYRTAKECLKACRPWMDGRLSPYMAFRTDIPGSFTREVLWREFTHESITPLESLSREDLVEIVTYHFGAKVGPTVMDAHTRVDPNTNTVIFVCSLLYSELGEPEDADDLLDLPCIDGPCSRETLRMFGWGQLRDGEGYKYTHVFRWPRLKDTPSTRRTIEFIKDNEETLAASFLPKLLAKHYHPDLSGGSAKPDGWWAGYETVKPISLDSPSEKDNTGRLVTQVDTGTYNKTVEENGVTSQVPAVTSTPNVQHYRIAQQKTDVEQDGSLTFTIVIAKSEWHGYDDGNDYESGGQRQLAGVSAPQGYGITEHRVIPSVPRENAIPTMNAIEARNGYELVTQKSQSEGQEGSSDISFQRKPLWDYLGNLDGHTPDFVNIDSNSFNATTYRYDPNTNSYTLDWNYVNPAKTQDLVDKARAALGGTPTVTVQHHPEGYDSVHIVGKGKGAHHIDEWLVSADWFKHETVEQWIGVSIVKRDGKPYAFEYRPTVYKTDSTTGDQTIDWDATMAGTLVTVLFSSVRGDLDANWMGSDPQRETQVTPVTPVEAVSAQASSGGQPDVYVTIGMEPDGKVALSPAPSHVDHHGNGWSGSTWTDPDDGTTTPPESSENSTSDGRDKQRSHCMTRIGRHVNEDGTYNVTVTRVYPHQRYWTWDTEGENRSGDTRTVYHFAYRNWPSRKAIQTDIIEKIKTKIGVGENWSDGWTLNGSISVNEYGLVDAPGVTLAPSWGNQNRIRRAFTKTITFHTISRMPVIEKTYTAPQPFAAANPIQKPNDGFWWRVVWYSIYEGETTSSSEANGQQTARGGPCQGSKGVKRLTAKTGVQARWSWHSVYNVEYGEWKNTVLQKFEGKSKSGDGVATDEDEYDVSGETRQRELAVLEAYKFNSENWEGATHPITDKWNAAHPNDQISPTLIND